MVIQLIGRAAVVFDGHWKELATNIDEGDRRHSKNIVWVSHFATIRAGEFHEGKGNLLQCLEIEIGI